MGMFDYVRCEVELPDGFTGKLQTKCFDNEMTTYTITEDGRLVSDDTHDECVPEEERPYPKAPKDSPLSFFGCIRTVVDRPNVDRNFHGILNFYGLSDDGEWHEYNAKFTDGQLVEIVLAAHMQTERALEQESHPQESA